MTERGVAAFPAAHENTREFRKAWIMPGDQQGFYRRGCAFKKVSQLIGIGAVKQIFDFAGRFLRKFPQHDIERVARAPGRRNKGELGNETSCVTIGAHARRISASPLRQWPFKIAFGSVSHGFRMTNEEEY
jgi:hypothetical protein